MRAAYYERQGAAREVIQIGDLPRPTAAAGEVLVRVHVSGINPSDIKTRTGFVSKMAFDCIIPHQDGAGTIEAVGDGVSPARIGERVWLFEAQWGRAAGTAADYIAIPADRAVPLPDGISFETGASLGVPALTAHRCLFAEGGLHGRRVLVQGGAGAVGSAAIQLARLAGAWVAASVRRPEQAAIARDAGADLVINLNDGDLVREIEAATSGVGVDRIVEVDLTTNLASDLACLRVGGSISSYATGGASAEAPVPMFPFMRINAALRFVYVYSLPSEAKEAAVADITSCLAAGAYKPSIGLVLPLAQTAEAQIAVETGAVLGRVLLDVASG